MTSRLLTFLLLLLILAVSRPGTAQNRLRSHTTELGGMTITRTTGTLDGQRVSVSERTSTLGNTQTTRVTGTFGNDRVNLNVRESPFGSGTRAVTTGRVGQERWNLTTRGSTFGSTDRRTITGTIGPSRINTTVRQRGFGSTLTSDVTGRRNGDRVRMTVRTTQTGAWNDGAAPVWGSGSYLAIQPQAGSPQLPSSFNFSSSRSPVIRSSPRIVTTPPRVIYAPPPRPVNPWVQARYISDLSTLSRSGRGHVERARDAMAPVLQRHSLRYAVLQVGTFARGTSASRVSVRSGGHTATYLLRRSQAETPWATYLEQDGLLVVPIDPNKATRAVHVWFH